MKHKPKLLIFASGTKDGGGSGFEQLVINSRTGVLEAEIVGVVSNYPHGGVRRLADAYQVRFLFFEPPFPSAGYEKFLADTQADFVALSGWLKLVQKLPAACTINIHPGPLPEFGGPGLYGHHVHEAVIKAYQAGCTEFSAVSMHFVTEQYDEGPIFFRYPVYIDPHDNSETLAARINKIEHGWQGFITNLVVQEQIRWRGSKGEQVIVPAWYKKMVFCPDNLKMS